MKTGNSPKLWALSGAAPLVAAAALLFAATPSGQAMPPRAHSARGVIESVDFHSRTITLKPMDDGAPLRFVWNESTRFSGPGCCARRLLQAGQRVRLSYRRELGQNVLREVSTKGGSTCSGAAGQ